MALVHGSDEYTYLTTGPKEAADTEPTYPGTQERVPIAGESMRLERSAAAQVEEITALGAVTTLDLTNAVWRGTFTTLVYYNARWFHWFMCQLMGGCEVRRADYLVDGEAAPGTPTTNTHWYIPQSYQCTTAGSVGAIPHGLVVRLVKQGTLGVDNTRVEKLGNADQGLHITGVTFDFPADGWPTATWEVVGPPPVLLGPSTITPISAGSNEYAVRPQDNSRDSSHPDLPNEFKTEILSSWNEQPWRRFSLSIKRTMEYPPYFANDWDGTGYADGYNVGLTGNVEVRASYETLFQGVQADIALYNAAWLANNQGQRRMRWISAASTDTHGPLTPQADSTESIPYALQFNAPLARVLEAQDPVESGGAITMRWTEAWVSKQQQSTGGDGYPWDDAGTDTYTCPVVVAFQVADGDEPAGLTFSTAASGGNAPYTDITG